MNQKHLFFIPLGLLLLVALTGGWFISSQLELWSKNYLKDELSEVANISVSIFKKDISEDNLSLYTPSDWDTFVDGLPFSDLNHRITLIASDGTVLGDSKLTESEISRTSNHANRPEVKLALDSGYGEAGRYSKTLGLDMYYVAVSFEHHEFRGVLRIANPKSYSHQLIYDVKVIILVVSSVGIFLLACIFIFTSRYIRNFINEQRETQESVIASRTKEIELLSKLANMLAACNSIAEAQKVVGDIVPHITGELNGAVGLIRESRNQVEIKLTWGADWSGAKVYSPDECWSLRKGKYHLEQDNFSNLPCPHMDGVKHHQGLCVPLIAHGNTIGIMHWSLDNELTNEKLQLMFAVAEHLGMALANLTLQEKLRDQAFKDPLTSLFNRRYFIDFIEKQMMIAKREAKPFTLLMLDLDHFKRFNDNFGHDAGDYVIRTMANLLSNNVREEDVICRIGGEEFAIVLPSTTLEEATLLAEKVCNLVRDLHLHFQNTSLGRLTLSIGLSTFNKDTFNSQALIKQADIALYQAKNNGRDRYLIYSPDRMMSKTQSRLSVKESEKEQESDVETTAINYAKSDRRKFKS